MKNKLRDTKHYGHCNAKLLSMSVCIAFMLCSSSAYASDEAGMKPNSTLASVQQNKLTIKGMVTDEAGQGLPGVNIIEKGTTNGTISDLNGNFILNVVNAKSVLVLKYIGYGESEVLVGSQRNIHIVLKEDSKLIDEVIVTAYGKSTKAAFTGSASVVKAETLEKIAPTNITQGLQGLSAGVQVINQTGRPGTDAQIVIRGLGSMTASSNPLYVIDGVPSDAPLNSISSSDIESITVLKDAASTSLYGSRAGNGVILITTKSGKQGKTKVNLRASWATSDFAVKFPERVGAAKQYELAFEGLYNDATDFMNMDDTQARQYAHDNVTGVYWREVPVELADGTTRKYRSGWNTDYPVGLDGKIKSNAKRLWEEDLFDQSFKYRLKQDYGIDVSGGLGENNDFFVSASMLDDKGMHISDNFKRFTGRAVLNSRVNKWIALKNSILYTNSKIANSGFATRVFRVMPSVYSAFLWDHQKNDYGVSPYTGNYQLDQGRNNGRTWWPGWSAFGSYAETVDNKNDNVQTNSSLILSLLPGLEFKSVYSYQLMSSYNSYWSSPEVEDELVKNGGRIDKNMSRNFSHTVTNVLSYDKVFGTKNHAYILLGQEAYQYHSSAFGTSRAGLALPYFTEIGLASEDPTSESSTDNYSLASFFAKADYDFDNKYYISGSVRTDGSSRFHKDNRWGTFWSMGASWRLTQEEFMKSTSNWLNNLKLKFSYGQVGNDNVDYYAYQGLYDTTIYESSIGVTQSQLANPEVKWENNIQMNVGIDFTVFNKFSGSVEFFQRKSKDLLLDVPLAPSIGMSSVLRNVGDIKNYGWEFDLNYRAITTKNFSWDMTLNATTYKNVITSLPSKEENFTRGAAQFKWVENGSRFDIYMPKYAGVNPDNGRNQWWKFTFDDNGNITSQEKTENYNDVNVDKQRINQGSTLPKVYGSFIHNFRLKDFDLSFMLYYSLGGKVYDQYFGESNVLRENFAAYDFLDDRWKKPGDQTDIAKIYVNKVFDANSAAKYSDQYLFKNNYLRLRNLSFGYNIPRSSLSKLGIEGLRVYVRGDNLLTFGNLVGHGSDPENGGLEGVIEGSNEVPALRSYNIGFNLSF